MRGHLRRIRFDTLTGMMFSNPIAFFNIGATAATLHAAGTTDIQTSAQAAEALRPVMGGFAFALFGLGLTGTGMLAVPVPVPVLAGSACHAMAEAFDWPGSLKLSLRLKGNDSGRGFCGVIAVPIMGVMMRLASRSETRGPHVIGRGPRWLGWCATAAMAVTVPAMLVTL